MDLKIFDVEHGACALITCRNGARIMVDCGHNGDSGWRPGNYLAERGISRLDLLCITNYDEDHVSGLPNLRERVRITALRRNKSVSPPVLTMLKSEDGMGRGIEELVSMATEYTAPLAVPQTFDGVVRQDFHLTYPEFDDENNLSLVMNFEINGVNFLFPGDLEKEGWKALLERDAKFRECVKKTHVLVASHHGRENGRYEPLFDNYGCKPIVVVISDKGYAHDSQETVPYYRSKASGVTLNGELRRVLTTRRDDCIRFTFGPDPQRAEVSVKYDIENEEYGVPAL